MANVCQCVPILCEPLARQLLGAKLACLNIEVSQRAEDAPQE